MKTRPFSVKPPTMAPQQGDVHPMRKRFFRLSFLLLSFFSTVSALGCGKEWPKDDGYVFYKGDGRYKSTGEWLGPIVKTVMDGDTELTVSLTVSWFPS